jgi:hypothetical protein
LKIIDLVGARPNLTSMASIIQALNRFMPQFVKSKKVPEET